MRNINLSRFTLYMIKIELLIKNINRLLFFFLADRPDPLRSPEILIVIGVLLLWCGSIYIFIRHSELLRIRHRDLPFRSSIKPPLSLNHITIGSRTSDIVVNSRSGVSSISGLTPPISSKRFHGYRNGETVETMSLAVSPVPKKRRHTHSYDFNTSISTRQSSDKHSDKEHLLHPYRFSTDIKQNLLNLHRKSIDNFYRKSIDNLSAIKYSAFYSANDVFTQKHNDRPQLVTKKRCTQESPV